MRKKSFRMMVTILLLQILIMSIVYIFVDVSISSSIKDNTIASMETVVQERSRIIENYISETENYLTAYSRAGEITELFKNPKDAQRIANAQKYTEVYSGDREYLEGIYVSEWNTHVLAHTNPKVAGMIMRKDEPLKALQKSLTEAKGVYNTGIIKSPASGEQVISIYRAVYDEKKKPVGLVGAGVYTQGLISMLDSLPTEGMQQLQYCMIKENNGEYIFHEDKEKISTVTEDKYIKDIMESVKGGENFGYKVYTDEKTGEEYLASYNYIKSKGWIFIINDPYAEVFQSLNKVRIQLICICIVGILILTVFTNRIIRYLMKSLQKTVDTLDLCCDSINDKTEELYSHSDYLVGSVTENTATIQQLSASLESTDSIMEGVKDKVENIDRWMERLLSDMDKSVESSGILIESSGKMAEQSKEAYASSNSTFKETTVVVKETMRRLEGIAEINKMADIILDIAKQTNLLSLNAALEAARAGDAGKGFAVVANEIGELAQTTTSTASEILQICENINDSVENVRKCFDTIMQFMEQTVMKQFGSFAEKSHEYSEAVGLIRENIMNLDKSTDTLRNSLKEISESIYAVKEITHENGMAIGMIAGKNMDTSKIADNIQGQSDSNKELVEQLEKIIDHFQS